MDSTKKADASFNSSVSSGTSSRNEDPITSTKANLMMKLLLEGVSETSAENLTLGGEITDFLNIIGFDLKTLPPDIKEGLQTVAAILKSEGLKEVNDSALQLCIERRKVHQKLREHDEKLLKARYNVAYAKYSSIQEKLDQIRNGVNNLENLLSVKSADDENMEPNRILWTSKLKEYKKTVEMLETDLSVVHNDEIGPDRTFVKSKLLTEKLEQLAELNIFLEQFGELPPNILQAKSVLESKKRELEEIEHMINYKIN